MKITEFSLKRPSLITVVFLALFILGIFSYGRLPADLLPKMEFPFVAVMVPYPGAGPEDVERKVTKPMEDAMSSLNNIESIYSGSQEGMAMIWIEFKLDTDPDLAVNEVQRKYNAVVGELPVEAEPATILQWNMNDVPIMQFSVTGSLPPAELFDLVKNDIQAEIQQVKGVSRVTLLGGKEREIRLEVRPDLLQAYKIPILQVMAAVQGDNQNVPAGKVEKSGKNYIVRVKSQVSDIAELEKIVVARTQEGPVYLRDVARVKDAFKDDTSIIRLNGEPGIGLMVFKRTDANTIETCEKVREAVSRLENKYGVRIALAYDSSDFIKSSLAGVQEELILAVLIVALVIFVFLGSWQGSSVILLSIPVSLIGTLLFMMLFDISLNLMSLMGAALVVGIIVDDSIVVLENIQRHMEKGLDRVTAAIRSSREIGVAVVGISLTLVVVFLPMALVPGIAGKIFREFGLVVVCSTMLSLLVAVTLIPLLASRWASLGEKEGRSRVSRLLAGFEGFLRGLSRSYEQGIKWALDHKKMVLAVAVGSLLASGALIPLRLVGTEFMPKVDRGEFILKLTAPPGTSLARMDSLVRGVEDEIRSLPEVKDVYVSLGYTTGGYDAASSSNLAEIKVTLREAGPEKSGPVKQKVKDIADRRAGIESSIVLTSIFGSAEDSDLRIEVRGSNLDRLKQSAELIKESVASIPGVREVRTTIEGGLPEYNIRVDRDAAAAHGILTGDVAGTLGLYVTGKVVGKFSDGEDQYDVRLIADPEFRNDPNDMADLLVAGSTGDQIKLGQIARFSQGASLKKIERIDRQRMIAVNANLEGRSLGDVVNDFKLKLKDMNLPPDINVVFEGDQKMFEESMRDLAMAMLISFIFVYLIMVAIFESFLLPMTIWLSVPMAMVGALLALALTRQTLSIFSMVGMIMLIGLVTKNAILLVDFTNALRKRGLGVREALVRAGSVRLRPILMTTTAMVMAMLPLAMGISTGSEMRRGMSVALIGGLISSTCLTLFLVPVIYSLLESLKERIFRRRRTGGVPAGTAGH
ncbi:MAG: efflux RND transporter permease subunit [Peptococcaceae bacterium]|nr:efflux RND transporter permease subunit [Peptococcaceae bacterium]